LFPALADAAMVVLAGVLTREFGGRRRAQLLAAVAVGGATILLAIGHLLSTAVFDFLAWTALTTVIVHIFRTEDARWWTVAGVIAGIGLENKLSVAFLLAGVLIGMLLTRRDLLRARWLWVGAVIALGLWLPNLLWQAGHGWPVLEMSRSLHANGVDDGNAFLFLPMQLVFLGPLVTPVWIAGLVWLLRDPAGRDYRPVGVAWVLLAVVFVVTAGKPYYLAGLYPALIAAGAVWFERRWSPQAIRRYVAAIAVAGVVALPLALPVVPADVSGSGPIAAVNPELRETYGWVDFARTVDAVPGSVVFTQSYGEAGALDRFGAARPVYSGHNSYWLWGPPPSSTRSIVVVGRFAAGYVGAHFTGCQQRATIENAEHVPNKERGAHIWSCAGPVEPWHREWAALRHYNA
jgi:4-amino-4-deoxy-L-arabinose transferase-like glycosyltransferase